MTKPLKILKFQAENYKRLQIVEITPDGNLVMLRGNNGEGKSSVLDAINAALGGLDYVPPVPIREGEEEGLIRLDLGAEGVVELVVTRKFTEKGSTITVATAEGARFPSPQSMLDRLVGEISFDPLEFSRLPPKEQAAMLRRLVPLEVDLDALAAKDKADYDARRDVNRDAEALKARIDGVVIPEDLPEEKPDRHALLEEIQRATEHNSDIERRLEARSRAQGDVERYDTDIDALEARIAELQQQAETLRTSRAELQKRLDDAAALPDPIDVSALTAKSAALDAVFQAFAAKEAREGMVKDHEALVARSKALTGAMAKRESERQAAIAKAEMPVRGLGFGESGVTFNGLPLEQASSAEQLRVSTAIAMAANPTVRVLRIKDGSLLDENGLKIIAEMADRGDFQIWLESVGEGGLGIIMEDGMVREVRTGDAKAPAKKEATKPASKAKAKPADGKLDL